MTTQPTRSAWRHKPRAAVALAVLPLLAAACAAPESVGNAASTASPGTPSSTVTSAPSPTTATESPTAASPAVSPPGARAGGTSGAPTSTASPCTFEGSTVVAGDTTLSPMTVTKVTAGRHDCFDRLVFQLSGDPAKKPGYQVRYVPQVQQEGTGKPLPLRGGAFLSITVWAPSYSTSGQATYIPADRNELADVTGYSAFRQIAFAGSYEGGTKVGLGVREQLPFKVQVIDEGGSTRLVVDVGHKP